jgi:hypothetical protein
MKRAGQKPGHDILELPAHGIVHGCLGDSRVPESRCLLKPFVDETISESGHTDIDMPSDGVPTDLFMS